MLTDQTTALLKTNFSGDPFFVSLHRFDYHLQMGSPAINDGSKPGVVNGVDLKPEFQYVQPACGEFRFTVGIIDIGAYEFGGGWAGA